MEVDLQALSARRSGVHAGCIPFSQSKHAIRESAVQLHMRWHETARTGEWQMGERTSWGSRELRVAQRC
jgi:hypothetical protein